MSKSKSKKRRDSLSHKGRERRKSIYKNCRIHPPTDEQILMWWDLFESQDPEISTERLCSMICDAANVEIDRVIQALKSRKNEETDNG